MYNVQGDTREIWNFKEKIFTYHISKCEARINLTHGDKAESINHVKFEGVGKGNEKYHVGERRLIKDITYIFSRNFLRANTIVAG